MLSAFFMGFCAGFCFGLISAFFVFKFSINEELKICKKASEIERKSYLNTIKNLEKHTSSQVCDS